MPIVIKKPIQIKAAGKKLKIIKEYVGRINTKTESISIAQMISPLGWSEPFQTPEFDEYTLVLKGRLKVKTDKKVFIVKQGQAILVNKGERIQYSTPYAGGAQYVAICLPAFSPLTVHRDE